MWLLFILLTAIILGSVWLFTNWRSSQTVLPPGLTINNVPMGGMEREQALTAIELAYTRPVTVYYAGKLTPLLLPEMVELSLDATITAENLDETITTQTNAQGFVNYILDLVLQREPEIQSVSAVVTYSRERVDAFLKRTAQKYDQLPQKPVALPEAGTFRPPQDGTTLDVEASLPLLIKAILAARPEDREVHLVVDIEPAPDASMDILQEAIEATLAGTGGIAGVFAKDMRRGQELCINCDVAFSGLSLPEIAIALDVYSLLDAAPDANSAALLEKMLSATDTTAADALLAQVGAGNPYDGARHVTDLLWLIGLTDTFVTAPYTPQADATPPEGVVTQANTRTGAATDADPLRQTTSIDMGLLLEGLYHCARGGGFLRVLFPQDVTPQECQNILAGMERNQVNALLAAGMPAGTGFVHQHGWGRGTHVDLTLAYGPQADFILVVYVYQPAWLVWEESAPTFSTIGQLTYRFFNGGE